MQESPIRRGSECLVLEEKMPIIMRRAEHPCKCLSFSRFCLGMYVEALRSIDHGILHMMRIQGYSFCQMGFRVKAIFHPAMEISFVEPTWKLASRSSLFSQKY